ncbi:hypothetical protein WME98_10880 [Sorangium sp. So ce296]
MPRVLHRLATAGRALGPLSGAILRRQVWWRHDEHAHIEFALEAGAPR